MAIHNKRLILILLAVPALLLIPLIAMQFTEEVNWSPMDFVVMGILLTGVGLVSEGILRKVKKQEHRMFILAGVVLIFLLIWAELAVGIFGTPFAGS